MALQFKVDPQTRALVKVTEAATTEEELRAELQLEADAAQNRLNTATAELEAAQAAHKEAESRVSAAAVEVDNAQEEVQFSSGRVHELDAAVSLLHELAEPPTAEGTTESDSEEVPVRVAVEAQA